jgi:CBS domain-containing protein
MRNGKIRRLPVVDEAGVLIGLLSLDDILELLAEEFKSIGGILQRARSRALVIE